MNLAHLLTHPVYQVTLGFSIGEELEKGGIEVLINLNNNP